LDNFYKYEFYHSTLWIENGILFSKCKQGLVINVEVAFDMMRDRKMVSQGIYRPFFIDITGLSSVNEAARNYMASTEAAEFISAGAIYTTNTLAKIIGMAFKLLDEPKAPVKVFTNKEDALSWLETFKDVSYSASSGK